MRGQILVFNELKEAGAIVATDKRVEPAEHKKFVQAEIGKFGPVIKAAGQYAE